MVAPQRDPEAHTSLSSLCDALTLAKDSSVDSPSTYKTIKWLTRNSAVVLGRAEEAVGPFANKSQFRLYDWFYNASFTKSMDDLDDLLDVLCSDEFETAHLDGFNSHSAQKKLDDYKHPEGVFSKDDGWHESSVEIPLPKTKKKYPSEDNAPTFRVDGVHHRRLTDVIRGAAEDKHFVDQYCWIPPGSSSSEDPGSDGAQRSASTDSVASSSPSHVRFFSDSFNSNRMNKEFEKICTQPRNPTDGPHVEYAIVSLLLWSNLTHLTNFGSAALWPIYLYFGNLSKCVRGMPTEFAAHHLAYIPSVSAP